jgi:hypothetical protein
LPKRGAGWPVISVVVFLFAVLVVWLASPNPTRARVDQLMERIQGGENARGAKYMDAVGKAEEARKQLAQLGPAAYPYLGEMLAWKENSLERFYYRTVRPRLPSAIRKHTSPPLHRAAMREAVPSVICELGPTAARALNWRLRRVLAEADGKTGLEIVKSLAWSAPESPATVEAILNWLSGRPRFEGPLVYWEPDLGQFWRETPQCAPLLAGYLESPTVAPLAIDALEQMGTNAAPAVPAILSVLRKRPESPEEFITALGKIGVATPEVTAELDKLALEADVRRRFAAVIALTRLGLGDRGQLRSVLAGLPAEGAARRKAEIESLAELGPAAGGAAGWIRQFAFSPEGDETSRPGAMVSQRELRLAAMIALCRIAPGEGRPFIPELASLIGRDPDGAASLLEFKSLGPEIVKVVLPGFPGKSGDPVFAAAIILSHERGNAAALGFLREQCRRGALENRLDAAYWLAKLARDPKPFVNLATRVLKGLRDSLSADDLATMGLTGREVDFPRLFPRLAPELMDELAELGPASRPSAPELKNALSHAVGEIRIAAGRALRKIAPEEMPPIREGRFR